MNKEITLPYTLEVETITYQTQAFPLGMIKANIKEYDTWICNKFIDYYYHMQVGRFSIFDTDTWGYKEGLTTHDSLYVNEEGFKDNIADVIRYNKNMLENGHYIFGMYNEFYIPGKKAYQRYDFAHGYMIFGYDDSKQVFHSAGYLANGHYQYFDIGFEDYYKSIINCEYSKWFLYDYEVKPLLDYITNLQESEAYYYGQYKDYKSRNEKAIEYINKFWKKKSYYEDVDNCMKYATMNEWDKSDLLNILKGDDKE